MGLRLVGLAKAGEKKVSKAVAKKRNVHRKASRSGKDRRNSEILRAKRAVSAALGEKSFATPDPVPATENLPQIAADSSSTPTVPTVMKGLVRVAAGFIGRRSQPPVDTAEKDSLSYSSLFLSADPVAELARRHIRRSA